MTTLFSYCVRHDGGAAPNPFWGTCTLVICKPRIRPAGQVGDWIVGTGSADSPIGDISDKAVYVMQVTKKMTMREYDAHTRHHLPNKVPKWYSGNPRLMVGDSIFDFSGDPPRIRPSVHREAQRERDLSGKNALLSKHFFYFGDRPRQLPEHLLPIVKKGPGHRSRANDRYLQAFFEWLDGLGLEPNRLYGKPQRRLFQDRDVHLHSSSASECTKNGR